MAKLSLVQTNFTAGEISPRMKGRVDVARYQNGAEIVENGEPVVHGGIDRRAGLRFAAVAKYSGTRRSRVIRYVFNNAQAYMLEVGHLYIRVFAPNGAVILDATGLAPFEIVTPYTEDQLDLIKTRQGGDTLLFFHPDVATRRLRRISATTWTMDLAPWNPEPFDEVGETPVAKLSLSASSVGVGRIFTTAVTTVPDAPTIGTATPLNAAAIVSFTPPANTGGLPITSYIVTSNPGGLTGTGTGSPIRVGGLTNGVAYTFTVVAVNGVGSSAASAATAAVTPLASLPNSAISATALPADLVYEAINGTVLHILGPTAAGAAGVVPYTYAWERLGGSSAGIAVTRATTAQVEISSTGTNTTNFAALKCTVTDANGYSAVAYVNMTVIHVPTNSDGVGGGGGGGSFPGVHYRPV